tara:strand:+ start:271 stop:564 length:294 start_codon:yes stop_codon:yes gene_type:complete
MKKLSTNTLDEAKFNIVVFAFSFLGATLIKKAVSTSYKVLTSKDLPDNPEHEDYSTREVLLFSITTGIIGALTKVYTRKLVTQGWKRIGGKTPKELN